MTHMTDDTRPDPADNGADVRLTPRFVESLYAEAMLLADEARDYFDAAGRADRDALPPKARVAFACESLKVTTRIMHIVAWLLTQRAVEAGEVAATAQAGERRLGHANPPDQDVLDLLPPGAASLIERSQDLYLRVARLDEGTHEAAVDSPARALMGRLQRGLSQ